LSTNSGDLSGAEGDCSIALSGSVAAFSASTRLTMSYPVHRLLRFNYFDCLVEDHDLQQFGGISIICPMNDSMIVRKKQDAAISKIPADTGTCPNDL
jgi:hypothetical protein